MPRVALSWLCSRTKKTPTCHPLERQFFSFEKKTQIVQKKTHGMLAAVVAAAASENGGLARNDCKCFDICSENDFARFVLRLPVVDTRTSPWYTYLERVYGDADIQLPVDMRRFELFYSNLAESPPIFPCDEWLNKTYWTYWKERPDLCPQEMCDAWLDTSANVSDHDVWARAATGSLIIAWPFKPDYAFMGLQNRFRDRVTFSDYEWAEVIRAEASVLCEGYQYGVWFYPVRGSGVFLNTGRTAAFKTTHDLHVALRPRIFYGKPRAYLDEHCPVFRAEANWCRWDSCQAYDGDYAEAARKQGYTSFQRLKSHGWTIAASWRHKGTHAAFELVFVNIGSPGWLCTQSCIPGLRAGWKANRPCDCDPAHQGVNCFGSAVPTPPPLPSLPPVIPPPSTPSPLNPPPSLPLILPRPPAPRRQLIAVILAFFLSGSGLALCYALLTRRFPGGTNEAECELRSTMDRSSSASG
jgi:hypothetical protein